MIVITDTHGEARRIASVREGVADLTCSICNNSPVFVEKYDNARKAMDENIKFAKQLINFPK